MLPFSFATMAFTCYACGQGFPTARMSKYHLLNKCQKKNDLKKRNLSSVMSAKRTAEVSEVDAPSAQSQFEVQHPLISSLGYTESYIQDMDYFNDVLLDPDATENCPSEQPETSASGRKQHSARSKRMPKQYTQIEDNVPRKRPRNEALEELEKERANAAAYAEMLQAAEVTRHLLKTKTSPAGLYSIYTEYTPVQEEKDQQPTMEAREDIPHDNLYHPFPNKSSFEWTKAMYRYNQIAWPMIDDLTDTIQQPDFNPSEINLARIKRICKSIGVG